MEQHTGGDGSRDVALSAEAATGVLRDVEVGRARARLQGRIVPAWYGPTGGALLAVYIVVAQRLIEADKVIVQQWVVWPLVGLMVFVLRRAARRSRGVTQPRSAYPVAERRQRILSVLAPAVAAAVVVGAGCWALGGDAHANVAALAVALGLGLWAGFARRNLVIRRQLRELA